LEIVTNHQTVTSKRSPGSAVDSTKANTCDFLKAGKKIYPLTQKSQDFVFRKLISIVHDDHCHHSPAELKKTRENSKRKKKKP
jgi:hypothetical protein